MVNERKSNKGSTPSVSAEHTWDGQKVSSLTYVWYIDYRLDNCNIFSGHFYIITQTIVPSRILFF